MAREKLAYDPWGKRRSLDCAATPDSLRGEKQPLGFTGHEMLDKQGLVHMNGRVYDPLIGRFLSADALVEDPDNDQAYNRYSYVLNNPTNRVDPTGYASCGESTGSDCPVENKVEVKGKKEEKKDLASFSDYRTVGVTAGMLVIRQVGSFCSSSSRAPTAKLGGASLAGLSGNKPGVSASSVGKAAVHGTRDFLDGGKPPVAQFRGLHICDLCQSQQRVRGMVLN